MSGVTLSAGRQMMYRQQHLNTEDAALTYAWGTDIMSHDY